MGGLWHCFTHIRTITMKPQDWGTTWHYEMKELRPFAGPLPFFSEGNPRCASCISWRSALFPGSSVPDLRRSKRTLRLRKRGHVLSINFIWVFLLILILRDVYFDDFQPKGMKWIPMVSVSFCINELTLNGTPDPVLRPLQPFDRRRTWQVPKARVDLGRLKHEDETRQWLIF